jgi:hypothetical protein
VNDLLFFLIFITYTFYLYRVDPASANKYSTETEHGFIKNPTISFPETLAAEVESESLRKFDKHWLGD